MGKKELAALFSSDPDRYYRVALFDQVGFERRSCGICGKFFWTLDENRNTCPDHENYSFIGNPPTAKRLDYIDAWRETEKFFRESGHSIVGRYPVVCRWRDDLYFTIASIVDFQRVLGKQITFELPSNPLVVPQICLRFNDIENVGISGRHYTGFCMIGQTCNADVEGGYWKDKCVELDYGLLTGGLGIRPQEITFVEDVWMGAGAFGYSLEFFVRGLELGNAVFTEFEGDEQAYRVMPNKIIDMGAGLERFSWITTGTPTSYDSCFGPALSKMFDRIGMESSNEILSHYFSSVSSKLDGNTSIELLKKEIAAGMGLSIEKLSQAVYPYEAVYTIADHIRTLVFAISDGALPSNVGGGYNLRIILRRVLSILERLNWNNVQVEEIADFHIDYLRRMYPELEEHREDVRTILQLESARYAGSRERMNAAASALKSKKGELSVTDLIRLYESDGITPDFLIEQGVIQLVPDTFYARLADLHNPGSAGNKQATTASVDIQGLSPTKLLYYEDSSIREFSARIMRMLHGKYVVLDQTAFYPRGGGQEPDFGEIDGARVTEVTKIADVVVHKVEEGSKLVDSQAVRCIVDGRRRDQITKHHTATHVLNSAARNTLGSWVWQNSAFKDESYARLDITHHSALGVDEVQVIERETNKVIRQNLPVEIKTFDRNEAEQRFTFRIYQGGAVPSSNVRIVNIQGWDIEACGGTHVSRTGEVGLVKITKSERIQDGVVRLEFTAGDAALKYVQDQESKLNSIASTLGSSKEKVVDSFNRKIEEGENAKKKLKALLHKTSKTMAMTVCAQATTLSSGTKYYSSVDDELDEEYHIAVGEQAIELEPHLLYIALVSKGQALRVIVFTGAEIRELTPAGEIAKRISTILGGSGGGDDRFGQGGGRLRERIKEAFDVVRESAASTRR